MVLQAHGPSAMQGMEGHTRKPKGERFNDNKLQLCWKKRASIHCKLLLIICPVLHRIPHSARKGQTRFNALPPFTLAARIQSFARGCYALGTAHQLCSCIHLSVPCPFCAFSTSTGNLSSLLWKDNITCIHHLFTFLNVKAI